jgi:hypothetical protein
VLFTLCKLLKPSFDQLRLERSKSVCFVSLQVKLYDRYFSTQNPTEMSNNFDICHLNLHILNVIVREFSLKESSNNKLKLI